MLGWKQILVIAPTCSTHCQVGYSVVCQVKLVLYYILVMNYAAYLKYV